MTRTITAYFDTVEAAERAAFDLAKRVGGVRGQVYDARTAGSLGTLALPQEDIAALTEGFRRGGGIVHAEVPDDRFETVADALEASGAIDLDTREAAWRREGWTGSAVTGGEAGATTATDTTSAAPTADSDARSRGPAAEEERIPVVEERLRVGKREVEHGRVRIRSYVVETPVQEQVTLREERVEVERRPVDRPLADADQAAFRERTIEATETAEEVVVAKETRVKEELVVRKTADERTETVSDKVRSTEVEVDDDRRIAPGTSPGSPDSKYRHHDATPGSAPDRSADAAVPDSFPASDPAATTAAVGSHAVDPAELMEPEGKVEVRDGARVVAHFPDQERAKLAIEHLVRDIPLDRRCATITCDGGQASLEVAAPKADVERVAELLRRCGGQGC
jgi:uncharacterized protein (TIGR02271 family)